MLIEAIEVLATIPLGVGIVALMLICCWALGKVVDRD